MSEHVCPANVPACECGHRWSHFWELGGVKTYTSREVVDRYRALYGEPSVPFQEVPCAR